MKSRKFVIVPIIFLVICIGLLFIIPFKEDVWDSNLKLLENKILSSKGKEIVNLSTFTPFEWDIAYSFAPYLDKEEIYETIGYKWDDIYETVSEGMNQVVFVKDGKVVCYLYGYPDNNGFGINFYKYLSNDKATILYSEHNNIFDVKTNGEVVYLKYREME